MSAFLLRIALCVGCGLLALVTSCKTSPEAALDHFYKSTGPEDTLMDPLILAGETVVPLVVREVNNKNMPRRRYAIGFLGNGSYREALPVLKTILQDTGEEIHFRGDALHSIYQIDESLAREFAEKYQDEQEYLGDISRRVLAGDDQLRERRSYLDAWRGKHE